MGPETVIISGLTPLRGIAALLVAVFHFNVLIVNFVQPQNSMFLAKSYMMVDLFFIMSGFIIMHVYKDNFAAEVSFRSFKKYILARFARIYPLHLFTLLFMVAVFYISRAPSNPIDNPAAIPTNIFLLHSFGIHRVFTWNVPSWSISAEWWAYVLFPLLCLFIFKKRKLAVVTITFFIILSYISIMYFLPRHDPFNPVAIVPHNLDVSYDYGFLRGIAGFMTGTLMYLLYQNARIKKIFSADILCIFFAALLVVIMHFGVSDIVYIPAFALLVLSIVSNHSVVSNVLNNRVFQFLGRISYSIYLVHGIIISLIIPVLIISGVGYHGPVILSFLKGFLFCAGYLLIVIAVSALTYRTIELPCRKWINRNWAKRQFKPVPLAVA
ncbi:MAG: acyltransferase [Bacteroidota bacterium]|nr:acyltransferase [Bacteroidota bacterium]